MYLNNKGSVLITTLMIFSIITMVCMMCIGLNYSNKSIFNLEYKSTQLKELSLGAVEIVHSNILKEVKHALEISNNEDEFLKYFLENNFIYNIKDISKSDLENVLVSTSKKILYNKNGFVYFDVICNSSENSYSKKIKASVKILNPYIEAKESIEEDLHTEVNKEENKYKNIDAKSLVIVYNYKEI